ncbi:MAG: rod shape-determining protein MreC [Bryobacteraceae bacterium]
MESFLSRYRNLAWLLLVIVAQLLLLAYQVKSNQDVRLIRVWAVTAVTPLAKVIETVRGGTLGFFDDYFVLLDVRDENKRMNSELGRLKMENQFLKTELSTADRARALAAFQSRSPSRTIAARIIGDGTGADSKVVFVDRGSVSGVEKGMAVITPDGIVGKVIAAYPRAAQVLLITDPAFAAGVISQKNRVHGTLKGQGRSTCLVDYVQNEEQVEVHEWFYTSGDDLVFPKGLPVGQANVVRDGKTFKEIYVVPSGLQNGLEEVLIVLEGVHQLIPEAQTGTQTIHLLKPPPGGAGAQPNAGSTGLSTDADRLLDRYRRIGAAEHHAYGQGFTAPNFNVNVEEAAKKAAAAALAAKAAAVKAGTAAPSAGETKPAPAPAGMPAAKIPATAPATPPGNP